MGIRNTACIANLAMLGQISTPFARAGDWPWSKASPSGPNTLYQIARSLDEVDEQVRDDGVVTIKQPDVWSQASMTKYRKDFEAAMFAERDNFQMILSARVTRTDKAAVESQTALGASLTRVAAAGGRGASAAPTTSAVNTPTVIALPPSGITSERDAQQQIANNLLNKPDPTGTLSAPFSAFGGQPFQTIGQKYGNLGLEPNVFLDEKKSYLDRT